MKKELKRTSAYTLNHNLMAFLFIAMPCARSRAMGLVFGRGLGSCGLQSRHGTDLETENGYQDMIDLRANGVDVSISHAKAQVHLILPSLLRREV